MRSLSLAALLAANVALAQVVPWSTQTTPVGSTQAGDPALVRQVVSVTPPVVSERILGTDAVQNGLYSWRLDGGLQTELLSLGIVRSVDWQPGLVVVASANGLLLFYELTSAGLMVREPSAFNAVSPNVVSLIPLGSTGYEAWYDTSSPSIDHLIIAVNSEGRLSFTQLPSITVPQTPSGLAADERSGRIYVTQPTLGLLAVERDGGSSFLVSIDAGTLGPLVGGVSLFHATAGGTLVFTTSPTTDAVQVHSVTGAQATFLGSFSIGEPDGGAVRVRSPKFLDVHELPLEGFPRGALVAQDGILGNYKLVDLANVDLLIPLPLPEGAMLPPSDGGVSDGGVDGGVDGGRGGTGGGGGGIVRPGPSTQPPLSDGCSCTSSPFALLPAVLLLWWIRRFRS